MDQSNQSIFECSDIKVTFGDVTALEDISVALEQGKIHAVVGQNGAGKTTFARVVAGLINPDQGQIELNGTKLAGGDVTQARNAGVELVHQSFALPPSFTVAETMQFGAPGGTLFSKKRLEATWQKHLDDLEISVKASDRIRDLPVESQQGVEIARALVTDAKLLILDEPTAVLSPESTQKLFERVRRLKERGVTVVLILHKIREVLAIADTVTVLRGGQLVQQPIDCNQVNADQLSELIIGAANPVQQASNSEQENNHSSHDDRGHKTSILELVDVCTIEDQDGPALKNINLDLKPGEIVGIAGVEGNGQRTLVRLLADLAEQSSGNLRIDGRPMNHAPQVERRSSGLRIIPFERQR